MNRIDLKQRKSKCRNRWYPFYKSTHKLSDKPFSTAVISPHAGFIYSGMTSLIAMSNVKKKRIWFFGTSHYEPIKNGLSIFPGDYQTSIGSTIFPKDICESNYRIIEKYLSIEGHRTEEHSIENVLYALNHFAETAEAFCGLVNIEDEENFERISDDIATVWDKDDSIVVSTDWNHFVPVKIIDNLMDDISKLLNLGNIKELYSGCKKGKYEACGIDSLYLASKILAKVATLKKPDQIGKTGFEVLEATNSSRAYPYGYFSNNCVGYIAARNEYHTEASVN